MGIAPTDDDTNTVLHCTAVSRGGPIHPEVSSPSMRPKAQGPRARVPPYAPKPVLTVGPYRLPVPGRVPESPSLTVRGLEGTLLVSSSVRMMPISVRLAPGTFKQVAGGKLMLENRHCHHYAGILMLFDAGIC